MLNYYDKQLQKATGNLMKIKVISEDGCSNWLDITGESVESLECWLLSLKIKRIIQCKN